jgi:hypothetical protein
MIKRISLVGIRQCSHLWDNAHTCGTMLTLVGQCSHLWDNAHTRETTNLCALPTPGVVVQHCENRTAPSPHPPLLAHCPDELCRPSCSATCGPPSWSLSTTRPWRQHTPRQQQLLLRQQPPPPRLPKLASRVLHQGIRAQAELLVLAAGPAEPVVVAAGPIAATGVGVVGCGAGGAGAWVAAQEGQGVRMEVLLAPRMLRRSCLWTRRVPSTWRCRCTSFGACPSRFWSPCTCCTPRCVWCVCVFT